MKKNAFAKQRQRHPGKEAEFIRNNYKLKSKIALITRGKSGIGRSVALHFAQEGAPITSTYLNEKKMH